MLTITAILRARPGAEQALLDGLLDVADNVQRNEPDTVGFFVSQDPADRRVFTTYERFTDQAAMDRHNGSATVARFFALAAPLLDGPPTLVTAGEVFAKA